MKDGYARSRSVSQAERPDKTLYKITAKGGGRSTWLEHVDPNDRAAFQLRLVVGALTDDDVLVRHVEAFRGDTAERLAEYRAIEPTNSRSGPDFYHYLLLRRGIQQAELDLEWADWGRCEAEAPPPVKRRPRRGLMLLPSRRWCCAAGTRREACREPRRRGLFASKLERIHPNPYHATRARSTRAASDEPAPPGA